MRIDVRVLGDFEVRIDDRPVPADAWTRRQAATLVKLLALTPAQRLHREQVIDALWPDLGLAEAGPRLHKAAHFARRATEVNDAVVLRDETVALFPDAVVDVDAMGFERAATTALAERSPAAAAAAVELYGGDLLPRDLYEPWTEAARDRLRLMYIELLRLAERWEDVLVLDPADEHAHLSIMRDHTARGNRRAALRQFERLDHALAQELGVGPSDQALALRSELIGGERPDRPPVLIGRSVETAAIEHVLSQAREGHGRIVFIGGPPGLGKSTLLDWARDLARGRGWRIGTGVAGMEAAWPFAPVLEAFADITRRHPTLLDGLDDTYREEIDRALRGDELGWQMSSGPQRLFVAAAELVRLAAAETGLVLSLDDLHHADEASLRLVHYLARTLQHEPLVILVAHRPAARSSLDEIRASLINKQAALEVILTPLEPSDVGALVELHAPSASPDAVARINSLSDGVPFAVVELTRGISADPAWPQPIGDAVLNGVDAPTREVLESVAVLGAMFDTDQFVALSGLPDDEAFACIDAALAASVIEPIDAGFKFRHGLVRDALLERVPPHRQRRIHRDAAARLEALGSSPARVGHHLLQAGDTAAAVPFVLRAAETEAAIGAYRDALDLLETVRTHARGHDRLELLALRGDLLTAVGDPGAAVAYRNALQVVTDGPRRRILQARLARAATMTGDLETVAAALDGLDLDGGPSDAEILLARANLAFFTGDLDTAWELSEQARHLVLQGNRSWQILELIALQGFVAHMRGEWFDRLRIELRRTLDSPEVATAIFDAYLCPVEFLLYGVTPYAEVIELCTSLRATATRAGALRAVAFATEVIGEAALLSGDLELAARELQDAVDLHHEIAATSGEAASLQRLAEVRLAQGDREGANRLLQKALPLARWSAVAVHLLQRIFGTMIAAAPDAAAARVIVDQAESAIGTNDRCLFCDVMVAIPAAIACADVGDVTDAERYLAVAERSASHWDGTSWQAAVLEARAHMARAEGHAEATVGLLDRAAETFDRTGQPLDAARCRAQATTVRAVPGQRP